MTVPAHCPTCDQVSFLSPAEARAGGAVCDGCGAVFAPAGGGATGPKIPAAKTARAPRPAPPPRPPAPRAADRRPAPPGRRRVWVVLALTVLVPAVVIGLGVWAYRARPAPAPRPEKPFEVWFPAPADWYDEPMTITHVPDGRVERKTVRLYGTGGGLEGVNGEAYAVRVDALDPDRPHAWGDEEASAAATWFAGMLLRGTPGKPEPATCGGYPAVQVVVPVPAAGRTYVIRGVAVENQSFALIAGGPGFGPDHPSVRAFFDSFRHPTVPPPDGRPADGPGFRHLGTVPPFDWAGFDPKAGALYTYSPNHPAGFRPALFKYTYPGLRREATFPVAGRQLAGESGCLDAAAGRAFVIRSASAAGEPVCRVAAYDLARLEEKPAEKLFENPPAAAYASPEGRRAGAERASVAHALSGDGRYLLLLIGHFPTGRLPPSQGGVGDATLYRVDAARLTCDRQMTVPQATGGLAASPDGRAVYVVAWRRDDSAEVWEVDLGRWERTRVLAPSPPYPVDHLTCSPRGVLFLSGARYRVSSKNSHSGQGQGVWRLDPTTDPPAERRLLPHSNSAPVAGGGRLLVFAGNMVEGWDPDADVPGRRPRPFGRVPDVRRHPGVGPAGPPAFSPDGNCLALPDGKVYWLAPGPLPEVDPEARWKW